VSSSSFSRDEIRAAAETHRELGPDYQEAVIESFLDKVGREIDARVDARLRQERRGWTAPAEAPKRHGSPGGIALAIVSMALGIPLTAITLAVGSPRSGIAGLLVVWIAIVAINFAYALRFREPPRR
jgi:hypothetical protein